MTQGPENTGIEAAGARLDAALSRLEAGMGALARRAAEGGADARAREAALEAALREASGTMGALIAEVREAIQAAEAAAPEDAEGPNGQG